MTHDDTPVRDALAAHYDEFTVERELHAVLPHVTYEVTVAGRRAVCKLARGPEADPATEARTVEHVARATSVPVPEVLAVGGDYFVAAWCEAVPGNVEPPVDGAWSRVAGETLATLHAETAFDSFGFPRAGDDGRLAVDARESWHATVWDRLVDLRDWLAPHGYGDVAADLLAFLRDHPGAFDGCGDPVLCHGNLHPAHLGVGDGDATCLVDFEHALVAPGEYDYWRTAVPVFFGPNGPDGDASREAFRAGYESVRALPDGFERRGRLYRALYSTWALQSLLLQRNRTGDDAAASADWLRDHVADTVAALRADSD